MCRIPQCCYPSRGGRRESTREQVGEFPDDDAIPARRSKNQQTSHRRICAGVSPDSRNLVGQASHCLASVREEVDDLHDRDLSTYDALELNVDRTRSAGHWVDRAFRTSDPASSLGNNGD